MDSVPKSGWWDIGDMDIFTTNKEQNYYDFEYDGDMDYNIKGKIQKDTMYLDILTRDMETTESGSIMKLFSKFVKELNRVGIMKSNDKIFVRAQADFVGDATPEDQKRLESYYERHGFKVTKRLTDMKTDMEASVPNFLLKTGNPIKRTIKKVVKKK